MVARVSSVMFAGIDVINVDVQVQLSNGIPAFAIVGLADKAIAESKERVRSSLTSIGLSLPSKRITVNLAPADLVKDGSHFDLAVAVALLGAMQVIPKEALKDFVVLGELSLDGEISPVNGVLPAAIAANAEGKGLICPKQNGAEAAWAGDLDIIAPANLLELIHHLTGKQLLVRPEMVKMDDEETYPDMADVVGQETARRALEIAAAGGHNMLMIGPPGAGKSMLASRLPGLLPDMNAKEMLEVSMVQSVAGMLKDGQLSRRRPFRSPHHNSSVPAMVGGGSKVKPGEITLAHQGVLFLDELPEFPRGVLESLRQPMETQKVTVARVQSHVTYPANFQLIAAMNPCKCGYLTDANRACTKAPKCAVDYQAKISGPLLDRIDLYVEMAEVTPADLHGAKKSEPTLDIAMRVLKARAIQEKRYFNAKANLNSDADGDELYENALPDAKGRHLLDKAMDQMGLSMRGYNRVLRVGRTIADLAGSETVEAEHVAEALSFRQIAIHSKQVA